MSSHGRATADDHEDQIESTAVPGRQSTAGFPPSARPNAFSELMKPKHKESKDSKVQTDKVSRRTVFDRRDGLAAYTIDPASFPASRVIYYNDKFVVIDDMFPKATVHLLILPRDTRKNIMRPQDAFDDPEFLAECKAEEVKVRAIVAGELRRKLGKFSALDKKRIEAMESDDPPAELPNGRDWEQEIISGIHANPSMNHVHIHVLSRDMVSDCMKRSNHYLSFTTDFLVGLDQFPLTTDDHRRHYRYFPEEMLCWRCGRDFGNKMAKLKSHLDEEFATWVRE